MSALQTEPNVVGPNILVIGPSCAGKTTLAAAVAERLGLRHIELDALFWETGWTMADGEVFRTRIRDAIAEPGWATDGNYNTRARDITWPAADTIVWLDFPLSLILRRILARSWRRWRSNELLWGTNRERFWEHFLPWDRSLIWYALKSHRRRRRTYAEAMDDPQWAHARFMRLRSPRAVERWLRSSELASTDSA